MKKKWVLATTMYWILLLYMVAALIWWFIALNNQNNLMANMRVVEINKDDPNYFTKLQLIQKAKARKTAQYIGEGITFFALILIGAVFVYRITRRQIKFSQQQQNFIMAVTHELKTPIAVAQLNLQTLQKRKLDEEKTQKLIANTLQEANRLNNLCNNILVASQIDEINYKPIKQEINFSDLVQTCVENFVKRFSERRIMANVQPNVFINGEELLLQMLVNNLVDNALKYSANAEIVSVQLQQQPNKIILSVIDEGLGIDNMDKPQIFQKFYRVGNENTRKTKGTGLGLYLCKKIAENHNGYITMTDNTPKGSNFTTIFSLLK